MTLLDNKSWGPNNALTVMLAAFLTANGGTIKWQGCKYFALIIRMLLLCIINLLGNELLLRSNILAKTVLILSSTNGDSSSINNER
ncbi:hypothetical protein SHLI107390_13115 [Shewanella livingstonensis]